MLKISEDNRDAFLAAVAWFLIVTGVFGAYNTATHTMFAIVFSDDPMSFDLALSWLVVGGILEFLFTIVAIWLGMGILNRNEKVLRKGIILGWLYVVFIIGATIFESGLGLFALSTIAATSPELAQQIRESFNMTLAHGVRKMIYVICESALIIWAIRKLSTNVVREEFNEEVLRAQ